MHAVLCFAKYYFLSDTPESASREVILFGDFLIMQAGIHGKIFSSDHGKPLPASIAIKGINYTVCSPVTTSCVVRLLTFHES